MKYGLLVFVAALSFMIGFSMPQGNLKQSVCNGLSCNQQVQPTQMPVVKEVVTSDMDIEIKVNNYRISTNLRPMRHNETLCRLAEQRAVEIQTNWSHDGFHKRVSDKSFGFPYKVLGENLAKGFVTNQDMVSGWIGSPGHHANIVGNYTDTCVRCNSGHCAQEFGLF